MQGTRNARHARGRTLAGGRFARGPVMRALVAGVLAAGTIPLAACSPSPRTVSPVPAAPERPAAASAAAPTAETPMPHPSAPHDAAASDGADASVRQAGVPVPNTQVRVPRRAKAGAPLRLHAPPGTRVSVRENAADAEERIETVPVSGTLDLPTPARGGRLHLLVARPGATAMPFVVEID